MIDISKATRDFTPNEEGAIKWFEEHGFEGALDKQYKSKTKFTVTKNGVTGKFELPAGVTNIKGYMDTYEETFSLLCELKRLGLC